ncbi:hypothetical protein QQ045_019436 [Rhodiola kirilowii]
MRIGRPQPYDREPPELEDDIHPYFRPCWSYLHWAGPKHFEETPRGSLIFYRDQLERMVHGDFIYRPYEEDLMQRLYHFGWNQIIPAAPIVFTHAHHGLERKKRVDWRVYLLQDVHLWNSRWERLIYGDPGEDGEDIDIPVMNMCVVEELRVLGELRLLNINPDIIQFGNGDDDYMSVDDDHVTNLDSQTPCYDRPSSSEAPPSQSSWASISQATPSPPGHEHNLRPEKTPKQSWLQRLRKKRKD